MPELANEYERWFSSAVRQLSRENPISVSSVQAHLEQHGASKRALKRALKTALYLILEYRRRDQLGRLRAALLLATTMFGTDFVKAAERSGVLLSNESDSAKFHQFLEHLADEAEMGANEDWRFLAARLRTYLAYEQLVAATSPKASTISLLLRRRPRVVIKRVLILTHFRFLSYLGYEPLTLISEWLDNFGTPEEFASIASLLVAAANDSRPLESIDFALPVSAELADPDVRALLEYGRGLHQCYEVSKDVSLFGYVLEVVETTGHPVFRLRAPSPEFERSMRLGFIRSDISRPKAQRDATTELAGRPLSILGAAEVFATRLRDRLFELRDEHTPFSRILIKLPLFPDLYRAVLEGGFYEDFVEQEELSLDFLAPLRKQGEPQLQLTTQLDLQTFLKIWRLLRFLAFVDIFAVRSFEGVGAATLYNSVLRASEEKDFVKFVSSLGIHEEQVQEFLRLVCADARRLGYLDLQYRPFLKIAPSTVGNHTSSPEILYVPALVGFGNALRNVQSANQLRLNSNAELFVEAVADVLGRSFKRIAINRRVKAKSEETGITENTDLDVVLLEDKNLYLFECKHSVPPTGSHEMRDIWEDIEKAVRQLNSALKILVDPKRLHDYLTGWFPGLTPAETSDLRIATCVLCSHRIFAGTTHEDVPIRDFSSLAKLTQDGFVGIGNMTENGELLLHRFRLTSGDKFSADDLDDYLSPDSKFFKLFNPFLYPVTRIVRCDAATVARETYVYEVDSQEWIANANSLGLPRLEDETREWKRPWSGTDLLELLKSRTRADAESPSGPEF